MSTKRKTTKARTVPTRWTYLFDATGETHADSSHTRAVLRWLLDVAARRGVGHRATRLLCALESHADDEGRCFPSVATLARCLGIEDPTIHLPHPIREALALPTASPGASSSAGDAGAVRSGRF